MTEPMQKKLRDLHWWALEAPLAGHGALTRRASIRCMVPCLYLASCLHSHPRHSQLCPWGPCIGDMPPASKWVVHVFSTDLQQGMCVQAQSIGLMHHSLQGLPQGDAVQGLQTLAADSTLPPSASHRAPRWVLSQVGHRNVATQQQLQEMHEGYRGQQSSPTLRDQKDVGGPGVCSTKENKHLFPVEAPVLQIPAEARPVQTQVSNPPAAQEPHLQGFMGF